jgi:hypothetical protein
LAKAILQWESFDADGHTVGICETAPRQAASESVPQRNSQSDSNGNLVLVRVVGDAGESRMADVAGSS